MCMTCPTYLFQLKSRVETKWIDYIKKVSGGQGDFLGIGDDCAVIRPEASKRILLSTDSLVEDIHFKSSWITPFELGYKSLAVNLSDLAAMGARPDYFLLSLSIPEITQFDWLKDFAQGFMSLAKKYEVRLIGGDTTRSPGPIFINVSVIGSANLGEIKSRSQAQPGDYICVTGYLGNSRAGLLSLEQGWLKTPAITNLVESHHKPTPRILEGQFLAKQAGVSAMMDISDGLVTDIQKIMSESKCGAELKLDAIALSSELTHVLKGRDVPGKDPHVFAAAGGEDYELLVTVSPSAWQELSEKFNSCFEIPLTKVGEITSNLKILRCTLDSEAIEVAPSFSHFN